MYMYKVPNEQMQVDYLDVTMWRFNPAMKATLS